jgi:hypothetical protein
MGVGVDGLVLGLALVHERLDQPVRPVDLEVGDADGELLAVGRMKDEAWACRPGDRACRSQPEVTWIHQRTDARPRCRAGNQLRWLLHDALADNENPTVKQPRQSRQVTDRPVCSQAR